MNENDNMLSHDEMVGLQAEKHDLVVTQKFRSRQEFVTHLMHTAAYEQAAVLGRGKAVLDLGCNVGYGTEIIGRGCRRIVGVDVSKKAIDAARGVAGREHISFEVIDGRQLPFNDSSFDMVVSCQVIEHLVGYDDFMSGLKRVLTAAGLAVLTTPNARIRLDPGMKPWNPFHVREFSAEELRNVLDGYFRHVHVFGVFAREPLHAIELGRVDGARQGVREALAARAAFRNVVRRHLRALLPAPLVGMLKAVRDRLRPAKACCAKDVTVDIETAPGVDEGFAKRSSARDFCFSELKLDEALDLFAICSDDGKSIKQALVQMKTSLD